MRKRTRIVWGIGLLAVAVLLVLNAFGVTLGLPEDTALWRVLLSGIFLLCAITEAVKLRIAGIFFPLALSYFFLSKEISTLLGMGEPVSFWMLMLIALLLTVGTSLLLPKHWYAKRIAEKVRNQVQDAGGGHVPGGKNVCYIDCSTAFHENIENNLGLCEVFFTNTSLYEGNGTIRVANNLGRLVLHVPHGWYVKPAVENSLGAVNIPRSGGEDGGKCLNLTGENSLGAVEVVFV